MMAIKKRVISIVAISLLFMMIISATSSIAPFFANAATPATFGNTIVGPYTDRTPVGDKDSVMYQAPETGTMTSISMYIQTGGALVRYAVYTDLNGQPDQLIAQSQIVQTTENSWVTAPIEAHIEAGQNYWLTVASNKMIYWNYDFGALAGNGKQTTATSSQTYGEFIPWGIAKFSIYATYTPIDASVTTSPTITSESTTALTSNVASALAPVDSASSNIPAGLSVKFQTSFESATTSSPTQLNMGISNFIAVEGSGTAGVWIEGLDRNSGVVARSGSRSLGMEAGYGSFRCELDLYQSVLGLSDVFFVDQWMYLPSDFTVKYSPNGGYFMLFQFEGTYSAGCYPIYGLMLGPQNSDGTFPLSFGGRDYTGAKIADPYIQMLYSHFDLPRGEWFHFQWYQSVGRDGFVKAWINGVEVANVSGIDTTTMGTEWYINTDIYFNRDDMSMRRLWIDDITIYG